MKTKTNLLLISLIITVITLLSFACKKNPTEPIEEDNSVPGSRDYVWTVDTLNIPFNLLSRIWGSASNDVWVTGNGGSLSQTIHHYDGVKWKTDGISRLLSPWSLFGFASDNVWIGGQQGRIWHYDGTQWKENLQFTLPNYTNIYFVDIWGDSPDDFYAVGAAETSSTYKGIILHYNKLKWSLVNVPEVKCSFVKIRRASAESSMYYLLGYEYNSTDGSGGADSAKIYQFDGSNLREIYTSSCSSDQLGTFESIGGKMYFLKGRNICSYKNGNFNQLYNISEPKFNNAFVGRSSKDMILFMDNGIAHYNGTDVQYLYYYGSSNIGGTGDTIIKDAVFAMAYDYAKGLNLIIKGILKTK